MKELKTLDKMEEAIRNIRAGFVTLAEASKQLNQNSQEVMRLVGKTKEEPTEHTQPYKAYRDAVVATIQANSILRAQMRPPTNLPQDRLERYLRDFCVLHVGAGQRVGKSMCVGILIQEYPELFDGKSVLFITKSCSYYHYKSDEGVAFYEPNQCRHFVVTDWDLLNITLCEDRCIGVLKWDYVFVEDPNWGKPGESLSSVLKKLGKSTDQTFVILGY